MKIPATASKAAMAVRDCAVAMLSGAILHARNNVTAGNGLVIDWRKTRNGDVIVDRADAFTAARVFVELVGASAARRAAARHEDPTGEIRRAFRDGIRAQRAAESAALTMRSA